MHASGHTTTTTKNLWQTADPIAIIAAPGVCGAVSAKDRCGAGLSHRPGGTRGVWTSNPFRLVRRALGLYWASARNIVEDWMNNDTLGILR